MLQSILHNDVQYEQNKLVSKNDISTEVSVYDVELFGVQLAICIGQIVDTFIDRQIYYCPVYVIINKLKVEKIGYFEFYKKELSTITDSNGNIDIVLLIGPLTFNYVDSDYLIHLINKDNFLKNFNLEEEKFNKINLRKTKTKSNEQYDEGFDKEPGSEITAAVYSAIKVNTELKLQESSMYDSINEIKDINKIKTNGETKLNKSLLNKSKKIYLEDIKKYKGKNNFWINNHYKNEFFSILDVESNGDCFFATIREAFKTMSVTVTVEILRKILSNHITEEQFKTNKEIYNELFSVLKNYKQEHVENLSKIKNLEKQQKSLIETGKKNQNDRRRVMTIANKNNKLKEQLIVLNNEKKRIETGFANSKILYNEKKFMKGIKSFKKYKEIINTTTYWADESAISILEFLLNIKIIILSEEQYDRGAPNILSCGTTILKPIERRGEFNPKYYIIVNHTGNHYKLIKYKEQALFTFYDLPNVIRENIKSTCSNSLFKYIPLFSEYFKKSK